MVRAVSCLRMRWARSTLRRSKPRMRDRQAVKKVKRSPVLKAAMAATAESQVMITPGLREFIKNPLSAILEYCLPGTLASSLAWRLILTFLTSPKIPIMIKTKAPAYPMALRCCMSLARCVEAELARDT